MDMRQAGYVPEGPTDTHVGIASIFPGTGYDPNVTYRNEILGSLIWGDYEFVRRSDDIMEEAKETVRAKPYVDASGGGLGGDDANDNLSIPQTANLSYYANLVSRLCTKIINVPVLTDNAPIGINGCLGSLALACVDNNRRFQGDPTYGDPAICEILSKDFMPPEGDH